jgi:eukaryotic-like serine/threonine-protein kinase
VNQREFADGAVVPGTRYRVVRLIGFGGMGSVYEVEHLELGKHFVLKVLLRDLSTRSDLVARMKTEQRALGQLEHPNIVRVTDAGSTPDNVPFYVMERLEGETLADRMRRSMRFVLPEVLQLGVHVAHGLAAAHQLGFVHRDIKPPNLFLEKNGNTKILDFGIAKVQTAQVITAVGLAIGTPRYMSPEQARGEAVDGRADLYALGLILFELCAGRGPFDERREASELLLAHIAVPAPRLAQFAPHLPSDLDGLVATMLDKDPKARPASADHVANALRRLLARYAPGPSVDAPTVVAAYDADTYASAAAAPVHHPAAAATTGVIATDEARTSVDPPLALPDSGRGNTVGLGHHTPAGTPARRPGMLGGDTVINEAYTVPLELHQLGPRTGTQRLEDRPAPRPSSIVDAETRTAVPAPAIVNTPVATVTTAPSQASGSRGAAAIAVTALVVVGLLVGGGIGTWWVIGRRAAPASEAAASAIEPPLAASAPVPALVASSVSATPQPSTSAATPPSPAAEGGGSTTTATPAAPGRPARPGPPRGKQALPHSGL